MNGACSSADLLYRQHQFAAHIRDPDRHACPSDVDPKRMQVYCDLFYNNIEELLSSTFPVLREVVDDAYWHALARGFYARHSAQTPRFLELSAEFLDYLRDEREPHPSDPRFLVALTHYEWVELALAVAPAELPAPGERIGKGLHLSPLAWNLVYPFPVHRICRDFIATEEQKTHLLVYRDRHDEIGFLELNDLSARLLELIKDHEGCAFDWLLQRLAGEFDYAGELIREGMQRVIEDLKRRDVVLSGDEAGRCEP